MSITTPRKIGMSNMRGKRWLPEDGHQLKSDSRFQDTKYPQWSCILIKDALIRRRRKLSKLSDCKGRSFT